MNVSIAGLAKGLHRGTVTVTSTQALNSPLTVEATLLLDEGQQNQPPPTPVQMSPADGSDVYTLRPELVVQNVVDPDGHAVTYNFEIFRMGENTAIAVISNVPPGNSITIGRPEQPLPANATYQWRVQAKDSLGAESAWSGRWLFNVHEEQGGGGCGCSSSSSGAVGWSVFIVALLVLGRRKARKASAERAWR